MPNLTWSSIACEVLMDAGGPPTIPAFSTIMACSTSMIGAIEELAQISKGKRAIGTICADGGQGSVVLLEAG